MDYNSSNYLSPLGLLVKNSGKHPISLQGHYDHWVKYDGKKTYSVHPEQGIKAHLQRLRFQRSVTQLKLKRKKEKTIFLKKRSTFLNKSASKNGNGIFDFTDLYNDSIETGSTWWRITPLPDIVKQTETDTEKETVDFVQQPFIEASSIKTRIEALKHFSGSISNEVLNKYYNSRTIHIYVACSTFDMKNEISKLELNVWPHLRQLCLQYNRILVIHNLHNFSEELSSLGIQQYRKEIERSIEICSDQKSQHIKGLILFGDEYDEKDIPNYLLRDQIESIKSNMLPDIEKIMNLQSNIQSLKQRQSQIKQQNFKRENTVENFRENSFEDLNKSISKPTKITEIDKINAEIINCTSEIETLNYVTNIKLIDQWYHKANLTDNFYQLVSESEIIKDLKSPDFAKRKQARIIFKNIKTQLCAILSKYAANVLEQEQTLFEQEIKLLTNIIMEKKCLLVSRTFTDKMMSENIQLQRNDLLKHINEENQIRYELELHKSGKLSPAQLRNHFSYIDQVAHNIQTILEKSILDAIKFEEKELSELCSSILVETIPERDQILLFEELAIQQKYLKERKVLNEEIFPEMLLFLNETQHSISLSNNPISCLISGPINGKTNLMCHLISGFQYNKLEHSINDYLVIYRLLGLSFQNTDMTKILRSVCCQLLYETKVNLRIPEDIIGLKILLNQILLMIDFKVMIFLDGIENIKEYKNDSNSMFNWLPLKMSNCKVIFSTEKSAPIYQNLLNFMKDSLDMLSIYSIPQLSNLTVENLIKDYISFYRITWTDEQKEMLISNIEQCKTIGFVISSLRIARAWTSSSSVPKLGNKLETNILYYFARLEDQFGEPIIKRLLGYISCFSTGVSIVELLDLMTFDDTIQKFLINLVEPGDFSGFSFSLLRCVCTELDSFLGTFYDESGIQLIKWRHLSYNNAAVSRYLLQKDKAPSYHQLVSYYYMNNNYDRSVLFKSMDPDFILPNYPLHIVKQDIFFGREFIHEKPKKSKFNKRRILQLPHHLMQSQLYKLLKCVCIFNFHWIQPTLIEFGVNYVIEIVKLAAEAEPEDIEYPFLIKLLILSFDNLIDNPLQFSCQILSRVTDIVREDRQTREVRKYLNLDELYKSIITNNWLPTLIPSKNCMRSPISSMFSLVGFFFGNVTCLLSNSTSTKLFITTDIGVLYIWDNSKNTLSSIILGIGNNVFQMILNESHNTLVMALPDLIEVWDIKEVKILKRFNVFYDSYCLTVSSDKSLFTAFFYGIFWISTWSFETLDLVISKHLIIDTTVNNKGEIISSNSCNKFIALTAVKYDNKAALIDIRNGEINPVLLWSKEKGSAITKIGISTNYYILCSRGFSPNNNESVIYYIDTFDIESLKNARRISGCLLDSVSTFSINGVGSHAITSNCHLQTNMTDMSIWNLETEEHKHCSEMENIFDICEANELSRIFFASSKSGKVFKLNIQSALQVAKSKTVTKRQNYTLRKYELNDQYIFLTNENNSVIEIYNMMRKKKSGFKSWRISNIVDNNDIMLPYQDKLIILSDKSFSPIVPDCKCVFQMIKIFDLKEGRIASKTKEVFIYPCREKEFVVLSEDLFIGLSDNRSHIVAWNLSAGQIQWRIRPNPSVLSTSKSRLSENNVYNNNENNFNSFGTANNTPVKQTSFLKASIHDLVIDSVLVSKDLSTLIVAYFSPFLCVFSLTNKCHIGTLTGEFSLLDLSIASLTHNGYYLIHYCFNDTLSKACLSLWNCKSETQISHLTVRHNVLAVILNNTATLASYFEKDQGLFLWKINNRIHHKLENSEANCCAEEFQDYRLEFLQEDSTLLAFNGSSFQIWNIFDVGVSFVGKFQPDQLINSYTLCLNDNLIAFVLKGSNDIFSLKLLKENQAKINQVKKIENYLERNGIDSSSSEDEE